MRYAGPGQGADAAGRRRRSLAAQWPARARALPGGVRAALPVRHGGHRARGLGAARARPRPRPGARSTRRVERAEGEPPVRERRPVWFDGAPHDTARRSRATTCAPGHRLTGPLVVEQLDTTTVVPPGVPCAVDERGNLLIDCRRRAGGGGVTVAGSGAPPRRTSIDPITFEVLNNAFRSIVDEMGALLQSVAFSLVVSEGRDYSGTICTRRRRPRVARAPPTCPPTSAPSPTPSRACWSGSACRPRSTSSPATSSWSTTPTSAAPTTTTCASSCRSSTRARSSPSSRTARTGRTSAAACRARSTPTPRSSHGEGLIIPPIKLARRGELDRDLIRVLLRNVRMPEMAYGDLLAQVGAVAARRAAAAGAGRDVRARARAGRDGARSSATPSGCCATPSRACRTARWSWEAKIDRDPGHGQRRAAVGGARPDDRGRPGDARLLALQPAGRRAPSTGRGRCWARRRSRP